MFVRASLYMRREENQLDVTEWFIALKISSKYFGHLYDDPQELETVLVLLLHVACKGTRTVQADSDSESRHRSE